MTTYQKPAIGASALVAAAAEGDQAAWTSLVRRFTPRLTAIARRQGLGRADAEDVTQECWILLAKNIGALNHPEAVSGWLATTAKRQAIQVIRRRRHECSAEDMSEYLDISPQPMDVAVHEDECSRLRTALGRLPERDAHLLSALSVSNRPSYTRVSALLGLPIGSIGPTRARALGRLRREMDLEERSA
jgi:RNA polymerase sigma factor (sigma-70 family)